MDGKQEVLEAKDPMDHSSNPAVVVKSKVIILRVIIHWWARVLRPLLVGQHWGTRSDTRVKGVALASFMLEILLVFPTRGSRCIWWVGDAGDDWGHMSNGSSNNGGLENVLMGWVGWVDGQMDLEAIGGEGGEEGLSNTNSDDLGWIGQGNGQVENLGAVGGEGRGDGLPNTNQMTWTPTCPIWPLTHLTQPLASYGWAWASLT